MLKLLLGDCLEQMKTLADCSVDAVVTDPPYGLSFMGKRWDYDVPSVDIWREVYRVLKPGGHVLSFGGTRTYHRMVVNIEDAGFEIRDQVQWIYGSGFPKSHNVSKAFDKMAGVEREILSSVTRSKSDMRGSNNLLRTDKPDITTHTTAPATPEAKQWDGWGSALKPANEPICLARKPLEKGLTLAQNVLKYGTGAINVDGCRIEPIGMDPRVGKGISYGDGSGSTKFGQIKTNMIAGNPQGRWPANLILSEDAAQMLDAQSGVLDPGGQSKKSRSKNSSTSQFGIGIGEFGEHKQYKDKGGASRFFYVAKASKSERNSGLEGEIKEKQGARPNRADSTGKFPDHDHRPSGGNNHPTVKPIKLMSYLCTLITPPGGVILDPFAGSGSTGVAAKSLGFGFIGCEMSPEYFEIARKRIEGV